MLPRALFKAADTFAPRFGTALESEPRKPLPNSDRFLQNPEINSNRKGVEDQKIKKKKKKYK
jgi:hypothetical protein